MFYEEAVIESEARRRAIKEWNTTINNDWIDN